MRFLIVLGIAFCLGSIAWSILNPDYDDPASLVRP